MSKKIQTSALIYILRTALVMTLDVVCHQFILFLCFLDYGDKENADIADRYDVSKENFPVLKLFVEGKPEPFTFSGEFKADEIRNFIKQHSSM